MAQTVTPIRARDLTTPMTSFDCTFRISNSNSNFEFEFEPSSLKMRTHREAVEARCGLVQEEHFGVADEGYADVGSLGLSSADASFRSAADEHGATDV